MEFWQTTCLLLCCYGYFKELRPSEPFLTEYLTGPVQNLTQEQVMYEVYPVWTYSYMAVLVLVFLLTDFVRYKPVIVFEAVAYIASYSLLLFARGVPWMQFMEFCYGIVTATEVAYYTYMYAQVAGEHYQKVASYTRTALLLGRFSAGVLGQVLYSTGLMDAYSLMYVTMGSLILASGFAVALPSVKHSIYFHRDDNILRPMSQMTTNPGIETDSSSVRGRNFSDSTQNISNSNGSATVHQKRASRSSETSDLKSVSVQDQETLNCSDQMVPPSKQNCFEAEKSPEVVGAQDRSTGIHINEVLREGNGSPPGHYTVESFKKAMRLMWRDVRTAYGNPHLVRWSFWSAAATCGILQILNYIQPLYEKVLPDESSLFSGAIEALSTAFGTLAALSVSCVSLELGNKWEWVLGGVALAQGGLLTLMGVTSSIYVVYASFVCYRVCHEFLITVASYQVARVLPSDTYGLVFGLNMFCALLMQTLLTVVVAEIFQVEIGMQFVIYGIYYACLALLFLTIASYSLGLRGCGDTSGAPEAPA